MISRIIFAGFLILVAPIIEAQTIPSVIAVARSGSDGRDVELKFPSIAGQNYHVYTSTSLVNETWVDTKVTAGGSGGELTLVVPDAGGATRRFFRLEVTAALSLGFVSIPEGTFFMGDQAVPAEGAPAELPVIPVATKSF